MVVKKIALLFFVSYLSFSCGSDHDNRDKSKGTIKIAVAANMQFAMDSISEVFSHKYDVFCEVSSGSSGMLVAQIREGAPFDVFVSANMEYVNRLQEEGLGETVDIYVLGKLEFVYAQEERYTSIEEALSSKNTFRVAIANERTAPYGKATIEYMKTQGILKKYEDKIIYCESINQVNQYLETKAVEAGFTSNSFLTKFGKNYNSIQVGTNLYSEINQGVLILKQEEESQMEIPLQFVEFLKSNTCKEILRHFGYTVN